MPARRFRYIHPATSDNPEGPTMSITIPAEMRNDIVHTVMRILSDWKVEPADQVTLLGLPEKTKPRALKRYTEGTDLPQSPEIDTRLGHILAIKQQLGVMFSYNPVLADMWITTPSDRFGDSSPLTIMLSGLDGMQRVRNHMEGVFEW